MVNLLADAALSVKEAEREGAGQPCGLAGSFG